MADRTAAAVKRADASLIERVSELAGTSGSGAADPGRATLPIKPEEPHASLDGYVRRSPVQPMYRAGDHYVKLAKKIVLSVLGVAAAVAVLLLALRTGFIRF